MSAMESTKLKSENRMHIGFVYDLRNEYLAHGYTKEETAEFDNEITIDAITQIMESMGHQVDRIGNIKQLVVRLAAGDRWNLVFNLAEGLYGIGRESQVPALLDAYQIPYTFSDPVTLALTMDKAYTKRILRDAGLPTAPFEVVKRLSDCDALMLPFPLFAKPIAEGTGKGITSASRVETPMELRNTCQRLLTQFNQPVLVESFLSGRDFTVGILGGGAKARAIGTLEIKLSPSAELWCYSYQNKQSFDYVDSQLVTDDAAQQAAYFALQAHRVLGCRDASRVDLRADHQGQLYILEINALSGLQPAFSDLPCLANLAGISYTQLIVSILKSAFERYGLCGETIDNVATQ